jgi:hypothetical protein
MRTRLENSIPYIGHEQRPVLLTVLAMWRTSGGGPLELLSGVPYCLDWYMESKELDSICPGH